MTEQRLITSFDALITESGKSIEVSPSGWLKTGEDRALNGKNIMSDMVHTNFEGRLTPEQTLEYQYGYIAGVIKILASEGFDTPESIGVSESLPHIIIGSNAGVLGFRDGRVGRIPDQKSVEIDGEIGRIHFEDGYKIGFAFTRALAKKGNFAPLHDNTEITENNKRILAGDVKIWLGKKGIKGYDPGIVIHMNPFVRDGFAFYINNCERKDIEYLMDEYIRKKAHQLKTTNFRNRDGMTPAEIEGNLKYLLKGFEVAKARIEARDIFRTKAQES